MKETDNRNTLEITDGQKPFVVIRCLVYNHEPYLRDCLEGFVTQKTNFPFIAFVHDDASTDGSAAIIREYAEKYPHIIKPCIEKENQYSKHDGSLTRILDEACTSKYIAMCEGDDYWTSPDKLQKQIDFLEAHAEYSMCFHNAVEHWEDGRQPDRIFSDVEDRDYTGEEIFAKWTVPTASVVCRTELIHSDIYNKVRKNKKFIYGDILWFLSAAHIGKVRGMSDVMSVYRKQPTGATAVFTPERIKKQAYHSLEMYKVFGKRYKQISVAKFANDAMQAFWFYKQEGKYNWRLLFDVLRISPKTIVKEIACRLK